MERDGREEWENARVRSHKTTGQVRKYLVVPDDRPWLWTWVPDASVRCDVLETPQMGSLQEAAKPLN